MAKRQNFVVGSTNQVTESLTDAQLNTAWDQYDILKAGKLDGVFNAVSDFSNDSSNEIANAIQSITGSQPTGASQSELAQALAQMRSEIETTSLSFKGYVATSEPSASTYTLIEGNLWINSATMPTSFPVAASNIKRWNGTAWVNYGSSYTPADFDFFRNINDNEGYYWFGGQWTVMSTDMSTTYFSLNQTSGKWEIKSSVNLPGSPTTTTAPLDDDTTKIATTAWVNANCGADKDLSKLSSVGKNISNWSTNVSNCIIEIPQDINLTLSSGTLTLKSGSKVYIPNGTGVFDTYTTTSDKTFTHTSNGTYILDINNNNNLDLQGVSSVKSGSSVPASYTGLFYDTTNNIISWYNNGTVVRQKYSFPICIFTVSNGAISSIDQVFNGFGYIGSTVFALPGVKALAPDGRNSDGTLKNELCVSSSVQIKNNLTATVGYTIGLKSNGTLTSFFDREYVTEEYPVSGYKCWYKPSENKIYNTQSAQGGEIQDICAILFYVNTTTEEFIPKYAFHVADYDNVMKGATSSVAGTQGLVPAPRAGDNKKCLLGDGTWGFTYVPDLFDSKWSDHLLDDMSWLRADTFSWQSGTTYSGAYQHLVSDISGKTLQSETIGGTTVQFYLADDGHKICPAAQETNVSNIYTATGVAWYYILDTANTRFKLPRTQFAFTGLRDTVGNYVAAGLPNITGTINSGYGTWRTLTTTGAFGKSDTLASQAQGENGSSTKTITFDASNSSTVYGNSTTVQPPATQMYLYFYVGNFTQDAITNTAGLNASLFNGKADVNLMNTSNNVDIVVESQLPTAENNYTWYRKYKSGWVEQGGKTSNQTQTVTLPINMSDTNYMILTDIIGVASWESYRHDISNITTTSFYCSYDANQSDPTGFYWEVKGIAA